MITEHEAKQLITKTRDFISNIACPVCGSVLRGETEEIDGEEAVVAPATYGILSVNHANDSDFITYKTAFITCTCSNCNNMLTFNQTAELTKMREENGT